MRSLKLGVAICLVAVLAPVLAYGQANATGAVEGSVTDQTGAVIPGAEVTLRDNATKASWTVPTNQAGHFTFLNLNPGTYEVTVTKQGFRTLAVTDQLVSLSKTLHLDLTLQVGAAMMRVEVSASPGAELMTEASTMTSTMSDHLMLNLPSINRDVAALLNYQATAAPTFHTAENGSSGDITGGSIASATPDQNTFMLDGSNNTSGLEGDNGYINSFSGDQRGIVPTPIESIQEVTVNTNNTGADFFSSSGGQMLAVTKRGHDAFHGAVYDYFQGDWLNSNNWSNNFTGTPKPKSHQNRYGFDVGGPMLPSKLGGKTYLYFDYEGQRYPFNTTGLFTRTVPSDMLRQGIIQIRTAEGVQSFDLTKPLNVCGPTGGLPCDPRNTGISSVVSKIWSQYMPEPNSFNTNGDKLNTFAYRGGLTLPLKNDIFIGRIDHDFGSKWRWMARYSWFKEDIPTTNEVDIGGLLKGDTKGVPASAASNNNQPGAIVTALDTMISPTLTNSFHFGYTRNEWNWIRNGVQTPQVAGMPGVAEIDGESTNALIPVNVDTQDSRNRAWYEHNYDYRDELTWLKGSHMFRFGGDLLHEWWHFNRYDNVVGGLTNLVYEIDDGSVNITPDYIPQPCSASVTTQCLDAGNASELGTWKEYYADLLGIVNHSSIVLTRTGSNLQLNPLGTPAASYVTVNTPNVYFSDTWKIKPNITLSYGLNWGVQFPPHDLNGRMDVLVDQNNNPISYDDYIANRIAAARQGQIYMPIEGFSPAGAVGAGSKYAFPPYYGQFGPRLSLAWSPGGDNPIFGHRSTVIRGGYARIYGRNLGINVVSTPILGDGFLQPVACVPTMTGGCTSVRGVTPATAFRIGTNADGLVVPLPAVTPTLPTPVEPNINAPAAELTDSMDQKYRPSDTDQIDFSIQRQFKGDMLVEVGYVGVWAHHLYQGIDLNDVPWMMTLGGQSFAQAYAALWQQMHSGATITPQPFFEAGLAQINGAANPFCGGYPSCTAALASAAGPYISSEDVLDTWSVMESNWGLGNALYTDSGQSTYYGPYASTSKGFSDYNALVVKFAKRTTKGLTMNANFTYGHDLGTMGLAQTYTLDTPDDVYNLRNDWTPQPWDRKFVFNVLGTYELPFGPGQRWSKSNPVLSRLIGGWAISPIITIASGVPDEVYTGGIEMGASYDENGSSAVPLINTRNLSNSAHNGITLPDPALGQSGNPNSVGVLSNPTYGGSGTNAYGANAITVYNSFRPFILGIDGSPSPDGQLRGPSRWNVDLGITKDTKITERVATQFYCHMFNAFNHMQYVAPYLNLQDPAAWGVMGSNGGLGGQYGALGNYTRVIELGLRVSF
jgi:hypothetical protein